ncbi:MAG: 1-acyl-sn-glycerol-3-phosphate acyltransferase [Deltaproteobacteria bacterium]|nr:1-acyl-sn-glycerol-3-phosphate acyltransferase [Deltaproteobacteria bacterium]
MDDSQEKVYYPYVLDYKPGFFLSWLLYRLFKTINLNEDAKDNLRQLQKKGTVVYAIKYRGQLDYLLYHYNFRRNRLPYPKIAFDLNVSMLLPITYFAKVIASRISYFMKHRSLPDPYESGFYKNALQEGTTSLIFLIDPKGFARQYVYAEKEHMQFLLETQKEMDRPIFIVPQLILYKMTPERDYSRLADIFFGFKDNPGIIRKVVLFLRHHRRAFIDFGQPLNLKAYLETLPSTRSLPDCAAEIRDKLIENIDTQKRIVLGPIMKSRHQHKQLVLTDERVSQRIELMASGDEKRRKQLRRKAKKYFEEIAADYNMAYIQSFTTALSWFWKKIYEGVDVNMDGLATVREWARKGPLIYIPSHKSHIDYLILNYVLLSYHMHVPRIAAGANLAFWPMGHIFRNCGAFFIRRSFKGEKLYLDVFNRYIKVLLEEGHPIEFFIEGGRSRNGKITIPKTGFLSILLQAYREGACDDLIFVPASIVYDRIMEEKSYLREIEGARKEKESFWQIIRARRFLKRRYGKIYVRFAHPLSLREYLAQRDPSVKNTHSSLALHIANSINSVTPVTPLSLVATAILANHRRGFHLSELTETVGILLKFLKAYDVPLAATFADQTNIVNDTLSILIGLKIVDFLGDEQGEEETFYYVDEDKKMELEYHKNSIIHFFNPHSLVAVSLLTGLKETKGSEQIVSDYAFLKNLFKNEFVFDEKEDLQESVNKSIEYFLDSNFLSRSHEVNGGYTITKLGFDKLPIWATLAKTFLESYWIAVKSMSQQKTKRVKTEEEVLKKMDYLGKRFHKLGVIDHIGALSQLNFRNAISFIDQEIRDAQKNADEDDSLILERLSQIGQRIYELSHYGA